MTRIDALRTGELEKHEEHQLEEHFNRCTSCHESVDDVVKFADACKTLISKPPRSVAKRLSEELRDSYDVFEAAGEQVWVAFTSRGIRMISIRTASEEEFQHKYHAKFHRGLRRAAIPEKYRRQIAEALEGKGAPDPEVDLTGLPEFERTVLRTICRIPRGEVRPYRWVARQVRRPKAARAIGNIMAANPVPFLLPCHRVVPSTGGVGKYGFGSEMKRRLLTAEGVPVANLRAKSRRKTA